MQFLSPTRNVQRYKQFRFIMQIIVYDALSACVSSGHVRSLQPRVVQLQFAISVPVQLPFYDANVNGGLLFETIRYNCAREQ